IVIVAKSALAYAVMRLFRHSESTALMIAASRAQIGEFSFILAGLGVTLGVLPPLGRDLILAAALISILLTPFLFVAADWIYAHHEPPKKAPAAAPAAPALETPTREPIPVTHLTNHVVLVGYGRVGSVVGAALKNTAMPVYVIENDEEMVGSWRKQ